MTKEEFELQKRAHWESFTALERKYRNYSAQWLSDKHRIEKTHREWMHSLSQKED